MKKNLPKYRISIDDIYSEDGQSLGISKIAYTKTPAILVKGMAFSLQYEKPKMFFSDNLKYRIAGPIMVPMEIYRNDEEEYYVQFTAEEIEKIHSKFMANPSNEIFNLEHTEENVPAYLLEAILVDSEAKINMIKQEYNIDVPLGTSFVVTQVTDKEYYNSLVKNEQLGFSIEGFLGLALSEVKNKKEKMSKQKFEAVKTAIGDEIWIDGEIAVDTYVYCKTPSIVLIDNVKSETRYPIWDPIVELEDGRILTLEEGKIVKVENKVKSEALSENKEKELKMEEKVMLPAGEYVMGDKTYIVKEDGTFVIKEELSTEEVDKEKKLEMEEVPTEKVEVKENDTDTYSKSEVDAKFDEIYKLLADLKLEKNNEVVNEKIEEVAMSVNDRFQAFVNFSKNNSVRL